MDLNALSLSDLKRLAAHLDRLRKAGEMFADLDPMFWVCCDSSGMRLAPVLTAGLDEPMPDPGPLVEVEPVPFVRAAERQAATDAGSMILGPVEAPVFTRHQPPQSDSAAPGDAEPLPEAAPQVTGPLTEDERAQISAMVAEGVPRAEIAAALGRKVQTVALWITRHLQEDGVVRLPEAAPATDAPFPADAAAAPVAAVAESAPVAPAAVSAAPLSPRLREIEAVLPPTDDADLDLGLAKAILGGASFAEVATDLGLDTEAVRQRWIALRKPLMEPGAKPLTLAAQEDLLTILRHRVRLARGVAA